ncbi:hypothetical protein [Aeromonas sp. sia0103]|uniref:hypothetical protein n=1 Tax=Aeromonas sp. sia0103 TaxID=2854782 RepID=UPI001C4881E5|nr:hypothetical protein [Aeromonas sp. sia0103]MBV7598945.1 hypothetical protein [Aeromonas sp. sia0103]
MIKNLFSFIMGAGASSLIIKLSTIPETTFNVNIITNCIIALATVVATYIHIDTTLRQKKDRVWEINKVILFDLVASLSKVIKASEYGLMQVEQRETNDVSDLGPKPEADVYKKFREKQEYVLDVYRSLMSKKLILSLEAAKKIDDEITAGVHEDSIDVSDAYEQSIKIYKDLQKNIRDFMVDISGVRNIK